MDADRRARILAMLDSSPVGVATLAALVRQVLHDLDDMTADRNRWHGEAHTSSMAISSAEQTAARAREDADRLAQWIIDHADGEDAERTELLNLHDRAR